MYVSLLESVADNARQMTPRFDNNYEGDEDTNQLKR